MSLRKTLLVVFTIIIGLNTIRAQSSIDSLVNLSSQLKGSERVDVLHQIVFVSFYQDPELSKRKAREALSLSEEIGYARGKVMAYKYIGSHYNVASKSDTAIYILNLGLKMAEENDLMEEVVAIGISIGASYLQRYQYDQAIQVLNKSRLASKAAGEVAPELNAMINISICLTGLERIDEAQSILLEALALSAEGDFDVQRAQIYGNLGILEFNRANYDLAMNYQESGLELFKKLNQPTMTAISMLQLGSINSKVGKGEKALLYYDSSISINTSLNYERGVVSAQSLKTLTLLGLTRYNASEALLKETLPKAKIINDHLILKDLYEAAYQLAELKGKPVEALTYYKQFVVARDSTDARTNRKILAQATAQYDFEKLSSETKSKVQAAEIAELKLAQRNLTILVIAIVFIGFVIYWLVSRNRLKTKLKLNALEQIMLERDNQQFKERIGEKEQEIANYHEVFSKLNSFAEIKETSKSDLIELLKQGSIKPEDMAAFKVAFENAYPHFLQKAGISKLTVNEQRLAMLLKLGLSTKELSSILAISPNSVSKAKARLSNKVPITGDMLLEDYFSGI